MLFGVAEPELVDVVVVGLGVGGEEVAGRLAEAGLSVVGVERDLVGGECPYWGCIPSKMMIRAANALAEARRVDGLAGTAQVQPDWAPVAKRIREEATDTWDDTVAAERFIGKGGRLVRGSGRLDGPRRVRVGDQVFEARHGVVLGTGTRPSVPPIDGLADTPYWTNHQAIEVEELPESLLVLGGGAIGLELAQVFARFGVRVTVVEALDRVLAVEEPEASEVAAAALRADGVEIHTGVRAERVEHDGTRFTLRGARWRGVHRRPAAGGDRPQGPPGRAGSGHDRPGRRPALPAGRRPAARHRPCLGGRRPDRRGRLHPHRHVPGGDRDRRHPGPRPAGEGRGGRQRHLQCGRRSDGRVQLAGRQRIERIGRHRPASRLPRAAPGDLHRSRDRRGRAHRAAGPRARHQRAGGFHQARQLDPGWIHQVGDDGFIKLVADADQGVLIGATSVGPAGGEVLSALVVAVHAAVPLSQLRHMIYAYPTFHRAIESALHDLS